MPILKIGSPDQMGLAAGVAGTDQFTAKVGGPSDRRYRDDGVRLADASPMLT